MKMIASTIALVMLAAIVPSQAPGDVLLFSDSANSNRVFISDNTNLGQTFTFEARVQFSEAFQGFGTLYREWDFAREDKQFQIGPNQQRGYVFPNSSEFVSNQNTRLGIWHHVAYVFDNGTERFYVNGCLTASRSGQMAPRNDDRGTIRLGTHGKDGFEGYVDWFRLSGNALYSGDYFLPEYEAATNRPGDLILYNFAGIGQSSFQNEAGPLNNGILGPFTQIVASPNSLILGDANGDGVLDSSDYSAISLAISNPLDYQNRFPNINIGLVGDLDGNAALNSQDLQIAGKWFAIPEPGAASLIFIVFGVVSGFRRSSRLI